MRTILSFVALLGGLGILLAMASRRLGYKAHVPYPEFRQKWDELPKIETGVRRRF